MDTGSLNLKYINQYKKIRDTKGKHPFPGSLHSHDNIGRIKKLIDETNSKSILDYGSGAGEQYIKHKSHNEWGVDMPSLYDPAEENYSTLPTTTFDGIISTDVFEHIPEQVIPECLEWIYDHATKFVYLGISTRLASTILPNGENAHCTVKPMKWWEEKIKKYSTRKNVITELHCYGLKGKKESNGRVRF